MAIEKFDAILREKLSKKRYEHTIRVYETAISLAEQYKVSHEKVAQAALLHDLKKCESKEALAHAIKAYELPEALMQFNEELWHGPVAAKYVQASYDIQDEDVLNSIYYHTTGRAKMTAVELIVFVADYIEPGRDFPGVDEVRRLAKEDLKHAAQKALQNSLLFLISKNATIHPDTLAAYNDLTDGLKKERDV